MPAITIFEILTFQMIDLENLGQGHRVQHSNSNAIWWQISTIIKIIAHLFILTFIVSEILMFKNSDLGNLGQII